MAWAPDYAEVDDLAEFVRITDAVDDAQLALAIAAASRAIDRHCRRQFGIVAVPEARYYTPRWDSRRGRWVVPIDDLMTVTGLEVSADLDGSGGYSSAIESVTVLPLNADVTGFPWTALSVPRASAVQPCGRPDSVEVTALFGWTAVPPAVEEACLLQASRMFSRRLAPFGIAGSPESGSEMRLLAKVDPDVAVALEPYRKKARPR